jgi:hypothetical protein
VRRKWWKRTLARGKKCAIMIGKMKIQPQIVTCGGVLVVGKEDEMELKKTKKQ